MLKPDFSFDYWGLPIYNLMGAAGVFCALAIFLKRERELNIPPVCEDRLSASFVTAGALSLLPANISNWFFKPELFDLPLAQRFFQAGINFYYGMFGFFALFALMLKLRKMDACFWVNEAVPPVLIFHAFGRVGCSLAGCCYGRTFTSPVRFLIFDLEIFPARELEAFCLFALFLLFQYRIKENRFTRYLLCYSVLRFFLELGRGDYRGVLFVRFLSPAQVTSIIIWIVLRYETVWRRSRCWHNKSSGKIAQNGESGALPSDRGPHKMYPGPS
jgi:phosphatidylglycerol:prolipoprotein diacylglycerol transferase